nr:MAG TPA: hypothetical protein [Caudoviricetes sp.]
MTLLTFCLKIVLYHHYLLSKQTFFNLSKNNETF